VLFLKGLVNNNTRCACIKWSWSMV